MDSKLTLLKLITLLFFESKCSRIQSRSFGLAKDIINRIKLPDQVSETNDGRSAIIGLRETVLWMIDQSEETVFDHSAVSQRVRLNSGDDYVLYTAWEDAERFLEYQDDELMVVCTSIESELKNFLYQASIRQLIHEAHRDLFYNNKIVDWRKFIDNLVADLEVFAKGWTSEQKSYILNIMSMNDPESIRRVLEKAKEENEGKGGFKSGWQALNRMLGESQQFRRGMFVLVGALTHQYKSGLVHDLFRDFCTLNDPMPSESGRKPMILYFSAENRAEEDMIRMYISLKENETGEAVDISMIDKDAAAEYVSRRLTERGFEVAMMRIDPGTFGYHELFDVVIGYENNGYEIQAILFDYLALINKKGCQSSMMGEDTRQLMQRVRTFMSARNILFVTPHQLSQEAMSVKRSGVENFTAEIAGKNYWDGSKRIANEADLEIYLDIVERNKKSYLSVARGKHRTVKATPKKYRSFYLPFQDIGYIPPDVDGEDTSLVDLVRSDASMDISFD